VLLCREAINKLVQAQVAEKQEQTGDVYTLTFKVADPAVVLTCTLTRVSGTIDPTCIQECLKTGQRCELGINRTESTIASLSTATNRKQDRTKKRTVKNDQELNIWVISSTIESKTRILEKIEEKLSITFIFATRPLATFPESVIFGIPTKVSLVSGDTKARPLALRQSASDIPPPIPQFIGSDLGIVSHVDMTIKIVDLGNACWTNKHFSDDIQTRQYRAPEVILSSGYDCSADIWSLGCIVFELITGDLLFDPSSGKDYSRDEDHLALITEMIGPIPKQALRGTRLKQFYDAQGKFLHVRELYYSNLQSLLETTYKLEPSTSRKIASFIGPCFTWEPNKRITAKAMLKHPFVAGLVG
jgi:serine/threonine protein kinase